MKTHLTILATAGFFLCSASLALAQSANPQGQAGQTQPAHPTGEADSHRQAAGHSSEQAGQMPKGSADRLASADNSFVMEAAKGGMAEVQMGTLARDKASNADVKKFGQRMVDDHSKANDELKAIAAAKGVTLPASLDASHQAVYDRISKLNGAAFDKAYMKDMVSDHKKDVAEFRKQSQSGRDPEIKAFAAKTLPTLEEHLKMAESIEASVGK
jgi:putative membrane protein